MVRLVITLAFLWLLVESARMVAGFVGLPVPAPILAMLMLFVALSLRGGVPAFLELSARELIYLFPMMFIPPLVALYDLRAAIFDSWLVLLLAVTASTLVGLLVTAFLYRALVRSREAR